MRAARTIGACARQDVLAGQSYGTRLMNKQRNAIDFDHEPDVSVRKPHFDGSKVELSQARSPTPVSSRIPN
jgi:hypothetical protein